MYVRLLFLASFLSVGLASYGQSTTDLQHLIRPNPVYDNIGDADPVNVTDDIQGEGTLLIATANWNPFNAADMVMPSDSNHYFYDANENFTHIVGYRWNADTGAYLLNNQFLYDYNGDTTQTTLQSWIADSSTWKNVNRSKTKLDANGFQQYSLFQFWVDTLGDWRNSSQTFYERNQEGRDTMVLSQLWNTDSSAWLNNSRSFTTWSQFNPPFVIPIVDKITERYDQDSIDWILNSEEHNTYDGNGNLLTNTRFSYNFSTSGFRVSLDYNTQNQATRRLEERFELSDSMWNVAFESIFTYNGSGITDYDTITAKEWVDQPPFTGWSNLYRQAYERLQPDSLTITEEQGINNTEWLLNRRYHYKEDSTQFFIQNSLEETWTGSAWENASKTDNTFNTAGRITSSLRYDWHVNTADWELRFRSAWHYVNSTLGIRDDFPGHFKLYPNPATDQLTLEFRPEKSETLTVQMLDISGRLIKQLPAQLLLPGAQQVTIRVNGLPAGMYLIRMEIGAYRLSRTWIKL